ncbi:hypothetical protein [uncultured Roseobacter sp.]|uniref:hypothetical protein n=1 Tax=uncultured Roseobacter sp. TaxID=114847 RepID=UPI002632F0D8|nr:hypothetical protein [uncultured Roseobacter sp.]
MTVFRFCERLSSDLVWFRWRWRLLAQGPDDERHAVFCALMGYFYEKGRLTCCACNRLASAEERGVQGSNTTVIAAFEERIEELESRKAVPMEKATQSGKPSDTVFHQNESWHRKSSILRLYRQRPKKN